MLNSEPFDPDTQPCMNQWTDVRQGGRYHVHIIKLYIWKESNISIQMRSVMFSNTSMLQQSNW